MPDTTAVYNWPVPTLTDDPNGPQQITDLANAIEDVVASMTVIGVPATATISLTAGGAWTDLCSVTFTLASAQPVEIVGWARMQSTGTGRPMVALQVVDGSTHLFGTGQKHLGGTGDALGEEDTLDTPRRRVDLAVGSHTIKLQAYRDTNGVVDVKKTQTLAGQAIATTGIEVSY